MHGMSIKPPLASASADPEKSNPTPRAPSFDDWNLLRSFVAIFETGTLTEAAKRLNTTQPSLGRHLRELEATVGETLFVRLPGKLKPTERARALFEAALAMRLAARDAQSLFGESGQRVAGAVRVAASQVYGYHVVPAILLPLLQEHPGLELELSVSDQTDNLLRRDADIAVRFFRPVQDDLIAAKVGDTEMGLFAHRDYIARHGQPQGFGMTASGAICGSDREPMRLSGVFQGPAPTRPVPFRFRTDFVLAREAAVESGFAIGMLFVDIARHRPHLVRVLADQVQLKQEVWLCAHEELNRSARMRLVWERLEAGLRARFAS